MVSATVQTIFSHTAAPHMGENPPVLLNDSLSFPRMLASLKRLTDISPESLIVFISPVKRCSPMNRKSLALFRKKTEYSNLTSAKR